MTKAEYKRFARARAAAAVGRHFVPRGGAEAQAAQRARRADIAAEKAAEATARKAAVIAARKAWMDWIKRAPDEWMAAYLGVRPDPWNDPRLSYSLRYKLRYRLDPEFHLRERLRLADKAKRRKRGIDPWRLRKALVGAVPTRSLEAKLGYSIPTLKKHIERQFQPGMNWKTFMAGKIDIDHIRPLRLFDLSDPDQTRRAWALNNLQPLWPKDNNRKGGKLVHLL